MQRNLYFFSTDLTRRVLKEGKVWKFFTFIIVSIRWIEEGRKCRKERKKSYSCYILRFYFHEWWELKWKVEKVGSANVAQIFTRIYSPPCLDKKIFQRSRWMRCDIFNGGGATGSLPVDWINSPEGEGPSRILGCKGDVLPTSRGTNESFRPSSRIIDRVLNRDNPLAFNYRSTLVSFPSWGFSLKVERKYDDLNLRFVNFWNDREDLRLKTNFLQKNLIKSISISCFAFRREEKTRNGRGSSCRKASLCTRTNGIIKQEFTRIPLLRIPLLAS